MALSEECKGCSLEYTCTKKIRDNVDCMDCPEYDNCHRVNPEYDNNHSVDEEEIYTGVGEKEETYTMIFKCSNCGVEFKRDVPRGVHTFSHTVGTCPYCGVEDTGEFTCRRPKTYSVV